MLNPTTSDVSRASWWRGSAAGLLMTMTLLLAAAATGAAGQTAATREATLELRRQALAGETAAAIDLFESQREQARVEGRLVEYVLNAGPALASLVGPETPPEMVDRLLRPYWNEVIPATHGEERLRAVNDCGVLLLRAGARERAIGMLVDLDATTREALDLAGPASASRFLANAGQALAAAGESEAAAGRYVAALGRDPGSDAALAGLEKIAGVLAPEAALHTWVRAASALTAGGRMEPAAEALLRAFLLAATQPAASAAEPLLPALAQYLDGAEVGRAEFLERWRPQVARLAEAATDDARWMAADLLRLYESPQSVPLEGASAWTGSDAETALFARLVFGVARELEAEDPELAGRLYDIAWRLDLRNPAALYLANLLGAHGAELDPDGRRLQQLVYDLFEEKNQAYGRLRESARGPDRTRLLEQIAQLHAVLGGIFDAQGRWGSPSEPASAIFQWQHALEVRRELHGEKGDPSPVLSAHLAQAYAAADPALWGARAFTHYLDAAAGYLAQGQPEGADVVLDRARELVPQATGAERERLEALDRRIQQLRRTAPTAEEAGDLDLRSQIYQRLAADPALAGLWKGLEVEVVAGEAVVQGVGVDDDSEALVRRRAAEVPGIERVRVEAAAQEGPQ